ncbi:MAG: hypothetical protein IE881_08580 [Epsilonproteobacteria bacterium]|nr:hypothetical protein [Campylobacterota bacterium]
MKSTNCNKQHGNYIFVNTNFKRKGEPIFVLAFLEAKRRISITDELAASTNQEELFQIIGAYVKNHYEQNNGDLGTWGKIVNYQVHLQDKVYLFDIKGNHLDNEVPVPENCATMSLK